MGIGGRLPFQHMSINDEVMCVPISLVYFYYHGLKGCLYKICIPGSYQFPVAGYQDPEIRSVRLIASMLHLKSPGTSNWQQVTVHNFSVYQ